MHSHALDFTPYPFYSTHTVSRLSSLLIKINNFISLKPQLPQASHNTPPCTIILHPYLQRRIPRAEVLFKPIAEVICTRHGTVLHVRFRLRERALVVDTVAWLIDSQDLRTGEEHGCFMSIDARGNWIPRVSHQQDWVLGWSSKWSWDVVSYYHLIVIGSETYPQISAKVQWSNPSNRSTQQRALRLQCSSVDARR